MSSTEFCVDLTDSLNIKQNFSFKCQGSEARIYEGKFLNRDAILKERFIKKYRHPDLDKALTTERMRAEARALNKCFDIGVRCPAVYFADLETRSIILQKIPNAITVKEILKSPPKKEEETDGTINLIPLAHKIGVGIAKMHTHELVHGDLTTSNLLIKEDDVPKISSESEFDVYFIDFGLSKRDATVEDKAVDLYVLERAISSSHPDSQKFFDSVLESYLKAVEKASEISDKLEEVRQRGRKRSMVG